MKETGYSYKFLIEGAVPEHVEANNFSVTFYSSNNPKNEKK